MTPLDWAALAAFVVCWFGYERILRRLSHRSGALVTDMTVVRLAWMRAMARRELRLMDSQLLGHTINSASFFGSANLILIAAVAGALFGGEVLRSGVELGIVPRGASSVLFEAKLALVIVCLARGFLNFIWSIRQLNYTLALMGAAPEGMAPEKAEVFAEAAATVLNPALSAFSQGVRGYYFALAAAAWLFGPAYFLGATLGAVALLAWRQSHAPAALGVRKARSLLEAGDEAI
ncbi:DUF599 domain-containing protein [Caulobacter sp. 17J80-11]|uniref:DUF599 domain-containing protein n=1 Tax=Caulobacter sp. 17J80-11 TaxID=2763502 RepID=UPI001653C5E4|nr:DUF599 family protein [Caulobacter sp. 17J80-11]MBC6982577.1 DUF599 family protein [Caulobacter sp. 17J80-11]